MQRKPIPSLLLGLIAVLALAGCDFTADTNATGDEANFLTFASTGPDGRPLGFLEDRLPMVDSTITYRVLVADTSTAQQDRGLPTRQGRIVWTVSDGSVVPDTADVNREGVARAEWTLGTRGDMQTITATLLAEGREVGSISETRRNQDGLATALFPGPPTDLRVQPEGLNLREGQGATIDALDLVDTYGNSWQFFLFDLTPSTSDAAVISITDSLSGSSSDPAVAVRATGEGDAAVTYAAEGRLTTNVDLRGLSAQVQVPVTVEALQGFFASFERVAAGGAFACAVASGGTAATEGAVYCWGANDTDQLGLPDLGAPSLSAPRPDRPVEGVPEDARIRALALGRSHACAVLDEGSVYCWGENGSRQLGSLGREPGANRALLDNPNAASADETGFQDIVAGNAHTCVLGESGAVYCWGANGQGQLGNGETGSSETLAQRVQGLEDVSVDALSPVGPQANHTCARAETGDLYCWGANESGQIGDGSTSTAVVARAVDPGLGLSFVSAGTASSVVRGYTCGVTGDGTLYCWGDRPEGPGSLSRPTEVASGEGGAFTDVKTGSGHVCLLDTGGAAFCFGAANTGQLGNGVTSSQGFSEPQQVVGEEAFEGLTVGSTFSVGRTSDGAARAWGDNGQGQLGIPIETSSRNVPEPVFFSTEPL
jgi:alpha-tubulin suppressor-like RCC1 family protein